MAVENKRVGLALGGGGARGLAHVGVLRVLEREGIPVDCIAGASVGALVGAAYAAGLHGDRLTDLADRFRWRDIAGPTLSRTGLFSFAKMEGFLEELVGDLEFADLAVPFAAVATDLVTGEAVIFEEGRVIPAVRASCSVPGVVTPMQWNGRLLVDGGVVNNLPISVVRGLGADVIVAVGLAVPSSERPRSVVAVSIAAIEHLLIEAGDDPAMADVYIPVPLWGLGSLIRLSARERVIAKGQEATEQALPAIRAALGQGG